MISSLHGTVLHLGPDSIDVLVAGVGYSVAVTPDVVRSARVGEPIVLHTNLIVREDALSLVGFSDRPQAALFTVLLGVSGVGPKSALGILAAMSVDDIARAVADDDDAPFRRVSGIGPKTAKLIVVQLAGKLAPPAPTTIRGAAVGGDMSAQVIAALVGLGWSERTAADAVASVADDLTDDERATVPAFLRRTLAALGPARQEVGRG